MMNRVDNLSCQDDIWTWTSNIQVKYTQLLARNSGCRTQVHYQIHGPCNARPQIFLYPPYILSPILYHAHVSPSPVVADHQACGSRRPVPRQWWSRPGWRATTAPWRRRWTLGSSWLLQSCSATRPASTLVRMKEDSPSSHGSAMVRLDLRVLILTKPNQ